jgi:hypothetical protein
MADETGASKSRAEEPTQTGARKGRRQANPARPASSRKPAVRGELVKPGEPVPGPTSVPDTEALERLRNRLMAKYHGRRR